MTFNTNLLLRVRLSKISPFCTKVGKGLCQRLIFYQVPFTHLNGFRLGTEGRYSVTNGKMFLRFFCLFCSADILSLKLTSERVLSMRLSR